MSSGNGQHSLRHYWEIVWRGRWTILVLTLATAGGALAMSLLQQHLYQGKVSVAISRQSVANQLTNSQPAYAFGEFDRYLQTQADLAHSPIVASRVRSAVNLPHHPTEDLLRRADIIPATDADLLQFSVTDPQPAAARRLAIAWARAYVTYRRQLDTASLSRARADVEARIAQLQRSTDRSLLQDLAAKDQQLSTLEALQTSNAAVVPAAGAPDQVQPRTLRNVLLGVILGLVLGIAVVFVRNALSTRIKSSAEIGDALDRPLIGQLPVPPSVQAGDVEMLSAPHSHFAEAVRMLKTNIEFTTLGLEFRTLLISSPGPGEGKSTAACNLAYAMALAGRDVVLADLDLRQPTVARKFGISEAPGITDAALGLTAVSESLVEIPIGSDDGRNGRQLRTRGRLRILPSGPLPPDPGEFVASGALQGVLADLREVADVVVLDAPPLVGVGDALALTRSADSILLVTRLDRARRPMLRHLKRIVDTVPTPVLGYVVVGDDPDAVGEESYYGYYGEQSRRTKRERSRAPG
jgi:capsular exopolysaccharide synthesis family protein